MFTREYRDPVLFTAGSYSRAVRFTRAAAHPRFAAPTERSRERQRTQLTRSVVARLAAWAR